MIEEKIKITNVCTARTEEAKANNVKELPHQSIKAEEMGNLAPQTTRVGEQHFAISFCRHCATLFLRAKEAGEA